MLVCTAAKTDIDTSELADSPSAHRFAVDEAAAANSPVESEEVKSSDLSLMVETTQSPAVVASTTSQERPPMLEPVPEAQEEDHSQEISTEVRKTIIDEERQHWQEEERQRKMADWQEMLQSTRNSYVLKIEDEGPANRYGNEGTLPDFIEGEHVPVMALINPMSGAGAGSDILRVARRSVYYRDRFLNIIDIVKNQRRGGLLDVFRIELCKAKDAAKALGTRPRIISGGGDGTASFAMFIIFLALKADPGREHEGLKDSGNGFIWSDAELAESFPALAQMPLGSANDFGNILGWGQKYPGDRPCNAKCDCCCLGRQGALQNLCRWISHLIDPRSRVVNFDVWGLLPPKGQDKCDFKIAELHGKRGSNPNTKIDGQYQALLKKASAPVPFFVCLYFSCGLGAYVVARFQLNRRRRPLTNRMEYVRQGLGIITERTPPQLQLRLDGVSIDCEDEPYFPPRRHKGNKGRNYREVGFYNINWQAHLLHGADRAGCMSRLCGSGRSPVTFNDGQLDMFRWKFSSFLKNPGTRVQTDKKDDMLLTFDGGNGKGLFFQWDGEARFAFSPTNEPFHFYFRKVLNLPVVIGPFQDPKITGNLDNGKPVEFSFCGASPEDKDQVRRRVLDYVAGELDPELNATDEDISKAGLRTPL